MLHGYTDADVLAAARLAKCDVNDAIAALMEGRGTTHLCVAWPPVAL